MTKQNQSDNNQEESKKQKNNHWLKLPTDFFAAKSIKKILKSEKNQSAIIFYLQLSLLTVGTDGYYLYDKFEDSLEEELALELDYSVEKIKKYLDVLEKLQLILRTNDTIFIQFVQNHTGKKDISNERVARYRQRQKSTSNDDVTDCNENGNDDVTDCNAPRVREELDNREELKLHLEKKEYIRKNVIERAMIKSFYRGTWNFIPNDVKEQDYKLQVYDAMTDWIIHNKKEDDFQFLDTLLVIVQDIYTQTNNNPEAISNIKECIASNKPMLIPDSMRSAIKKIQDYNKPLGREEFDKRMAELKKRVQAKDIN